ncbi:hypothetical protein HK405_013575, partial [Cladochytrium tenue]
MRINAFVLGLGGPDRAAFAFDGLDPASPCSELRARVAAVLGLPSPLPVCLFRVDDADPGQRKQSQHYHTTSRALLAVTDRRLASPRPLPGRPPGAPLRAEDVAATFDPPIAVSLLANPLDSLAAAFQDPLPSTDDKHAGGRLFAPAAGPRRDLSSLHQSVDVLVVLDEVRAVDALAVSRDPAAFATLTAPPSYGDVAALSDSDAATSSNATTVPLLRPGSAGSSTSATIALAQAQAQASPVPALSSKASELKQFHFGPEWAQGMAAAVPTSGVLPSTPGYEQLATSPEAFIQTSAVRRRTFPPEPAGPSSPHSSTAPTAVVFGVPPSPPGALDPGSGAAVPGFPAAGEPPKRRTDRNRLLLIVGLVVAVVLVGVGVGVGVMLSNKSKVDSLPTTTASTNGVFIIHDVIILRYFLVFLVFFIVVVVVIVVVVIIVTCQLANALCDPALHYRDVQRRALPGFLRFQPPGLVSFRLGPYELVQLVHTLFNLLKL